MTRAKAGTSSQKLDIVEPWKGHVRRADQERDKPVAKSADQRGHEREEDHHQPVRGDDCVPLLAKFHDVPSPGCINCARMMSGQELPRSCRPWLRT